MENIPLVNELFISISLYSLHAMIIYHICSSNQIQCNISFLTLLSHPYLLNYSNSSIHPYYYVSNYNVKFYLIVNFIHFISHITYFISNLVT